MNRLVLPLAAAFCVSTLSIAMPVAGGRFGEAGFGTAVAVAAQSEPEAIVRAIYEQYGPDSSPDHPFDRYFSRGLLKAYDEVVEGAQGDFEYDIDFDVFLDAQDQDTVTNIKTSLTPDGADKATVDVTFTAFGEDKAMTYSFLNTPEGWKIDNMGWGPDRWDLRTLLDDLKQQQAKAR